MLQQIPNDGTFLLQDLPGSGKRIDILCRSLSAGFQWGRNSWPLSNVELIALLSDNTCLHFKGTEGTMTFGEKQWAELIQRALQEEVVYGITVSNTTLNELIHSFNKQPESCVIVLEESGVPLSTLVGDTTVSQYSFMLGKHVGFDSKERQLFEDHNLPVASLGDIDYLGSHCIAAVISHFEGVSDVI